MYLGGCIKVECEGNLNVKFDVCLNYMLIKWYKKNWVLKCLIMIYI